jgi:transcriptional regulator with XRE-family HTH domain
MTEEEYIKDVCKKIKEIRVKKKMTQLELASKIGIDDSSLRRIESGKTNPTLKTIYRIASAFEIEVTEIFSFTIVTQTTEDKQEEK